MKKFFILFLFLALSLAPLFSSSTAEARHGGYRGGYYGYPYYHHYYPYRPFRPVAYYSPYYYPRYYPAYYRPYYAPAYYYPRGPSFYFSIPGVSVVVP